MAWVEDLSVFLKTDEFAEAVTYQGSSLDVIFENFYRLVGDIESKVPSIIFEGSDVTNPVQGNVVVRGAITYQVVEVMPDGTGFTRCLLERQ